MHEQSIGKPRKNILRLVLGVLIGLVLLLSAAAVGIQFANEFTLEISLCGDSDINLEYGAHYNDPGVNIAFYGTIFYREGVIPKDTAFSVDGEVDESKTGTYEIVYTAQFRKWTDSVKRTVHIVDTTPPVITLTEIPDHYTLPGEPYQEEGYTAVDNYDGDITDKVTVTEKDGIVTYRVEDSSGNQTQVEREIYYHDPEPPVLTLSGNKTVYLNYGIHYKEPGYSATDNIDGDLTEQVQVTGTVDRYREGTYTLTYTVTDSYENTVSATRTVIVRPKPKVPSQQGVVTPEGKVIYLTFDDGPGSYTPALLQVLEKYNVKATFFVVNNGAYGHLKQIAAAGHSIGIHTMSHDYRKIYSSEEAFFNEVYALQGIIYEQTGVSTTLLRFPGGSSNTISNFNPGIMSRLTVAVQNAGFQYFDWNVDSNDAGGASTAKEVANNVINGCSARRISIVLQHDIKRFSVEAVEEIIIWGLSNGYTFLPLDATSPGAHHGVNN